METPTPDDIASEVRQRSNTQLKRGLASRHMQMIAIGGAIGTGLFLASGATVAQRRPRRRPPGVRGDRPYGAAPHAVLG